MELYRCYGGAWCGMIHVQRQGHRFPYVVGGQGQIAGGDHFDPRFTWFYAPPPRVIPFFTFIVRHQNKKTFRTEGVAGVMVVVR